MTVVFATCDPQPLVAPDDEPLARALGDLGLTVVPLPWTDIDPAAVVEAWPIVLRSTWDYHKMPTTFAAWLEALSESGRMVMNAAAIARDNIDKIYLRGLEGAGIPIPATRWVDRPDAAGLARILRNEGWEAARHQAANRGNRVRHLPDQFRQRSVGTGSRARPGLRRVGAGVRRRDSRSRRNLTGAGTEFSHAVSKHALEGDFRVQQDFGGRVVETTPSAAVHALALQVMALVPGGCTYARIDIVEADRGPLLMELELIEPELYFTIVAGSAERMARTIADRLS